MFLRLKKIIMYPLLLLFLSACGQSVGQLNITERISEQEIPVIRWGVKSDTKLFGLYDISEQAIVGFDVDIARALTEIMTDGQGIAEMVEVNSKTRIPLLKNGNIDAIFATVSINIQWLKTVHFSNVYFEAGQSLLLLESESQVIDTYLARDIFVDDPYSIAINKGKKHF